MGRCELSTNVLLLGDCFQVVRPHAQTITTEVVNLESFGDWPNRQLVGVTMGTNDVRASVCKAAVTGGDTASPQPAAIGLGNLVPKPILSSWADGYTEAFGVVIHPAARSARAASVLFSKGVLGGVPMPTDADISVHERSLPACCKQDTTADQSQDIHI